MSKSSPWRTNYMWRKSFGKQPPGFRRPWPWMRLIEKRVDRLIEAQFRNKLYADYVRHRKSH